jgi:hypothetical protein
MGGERGGEERRRVESSRGREGRGWEWDEVVPRPGRRKRVSSRLFVRFSRFARFFFLSGPWSTESMYYNVTPAPLFHFF